MKTSNVVSITSAVVVEPMFPVLLVSMRNVSKEQAMRIWKNMQNIKGVEYGTYNRVMCTAETKRVVMNIFMHGANDYSIEVKTLV